MGKTSKKKKSQKKQEIGLEMSEQEYQELVSQVSQLTRQEACEELLECARYGEVDAVRAILDKFPDIVDTVDESGSTALHKASANGHVSTTRLLVQQYNASLLTNDSGNTPLHWAAASGHSQVVQVLLNESSYENVDVLQKNEFGRSILTEGFSSQETEVVKLLLEHDSASEEKLLDGGKEVENDDNGGEEIQSKEDGSSLDLPRKKKKVTIIHDFSLCNQENDDAHREPLRIREIVSVLLHTCTLVRILPIDSYSHSFTTSHVARRTQPIAHADNPFGDSPEQDTTGYGIWCASLVMARWMACSEMQSRFREKTILELGAGCGVPGLAAAHYWYVVLLFCSVLRYVSCTGSLIALLNIVLLQ